MKKSLLQVTHVPLTELKIHPLLKSRLQTYQSSKLFTQLTADIENRGILVPIQINSKNEILDGYHRFLVAQESGLIAIPAHLIDIPDLYQEKKHILLCNLNRKTLTTGQKWLNWAEISELNEIGRGGKRRKGKKVQGSFMNVNKFTGQSLGVSAKSICKARQYKKLIIKYPNLLEFKPSEVLTLLKATKHLKSKLLKKDMFLNIERAIIKNLYENNKDLLLMDSVITSERDDESKLKLIKRTLTALKTCPFDIVDLCSPLSEATFDNSRNNITPQETQRFQNFLMSNDKHEKKSAELNARSVLARANEVISKIVNTSIIKMEALSDEYSTSEAPLSTLIDLNSGELDDEFISFYEKIPDWIASLKKIKNLISRGGYGFKDDEKEIIISRYKSHLKDGRSEFDLGEILKHKHQLPTGTFIH